MIEKTGLTNTGISTPPGDIKLSTYDGLMVFSTRLSNPAIITDIYIESWKILPTAYIHLFEIVKK